MSDAPLKFEMADANDPNDIIRAAQRSIVTAIEDVILGVKRQAPGRPGLTWDEIAYLLKEMKNKEPKIIHQNEVF